MIKHSFIRSSKMPRVAFSSSLHPSPNKDSRYQDMHCTPCLRQSSLCSNKPSSIKQNSMNQRFLKHLLEDSVQQSKARQQFDTVSPYLQNQINVLRNKLVELQVEIKTKRGLEQRLLLVEERMEAYEMKPELDVKEVIRTEEARSTFSERRERNFEIMDSEIEQELSLASIKMGGAPNPGLITKEYLQKYIQEKMEPLVRTSSVDKAIAKFEGEMKQVKEREINILDLLEKYHDESQNQLKTLSETVKREFSESLKYQITKNNQIFFKMKSNEKNIAETFSSRYQQERKQMEAEINQLRGSLESLETEFSSKLQQAGESMAELQQQMENVIEGVLEEFNLSLQQVKSDESQLASISESLMDIIKCLVRKSGVFAKEQNKPTDILDIIKSNIIDINALRIEQSMISKEIENLKPPIPSSRRESKLKMGSSRGQISDFLSNIKGKLVKSTDQGDN